MYATSGGVTKQFKIGNRGKMKFTNASGGSIAHLGERNVKVIAPFEGRDLGC